MPFTDITTLPPRHFSGCGDCSRCCDGSQFLLMPLVLDDFEAVHHHFPILFGEIEQQMRAVMFISDGAQPCRYLQQGRCAIHATRPPGCRSYPLSPLDGNIMVDTDCPAVGEDGLSLCDSEGIDDAFKTERLDHFPEKFEATQQFINHYREQMTVEASLLGIPLYAITAVGDNNRHLGWHRQSLQQL